MPCLSWCAGFLINSDLCNSSVIQGFDSMWWSIVLEWVAISKLKQAMALRLQFVEPEPEPSSYLGWRGTAFGCSTSPWCKKLNVILWRLNSGCLCDEQIELADFEQVYPVLIPLIFWVCCFCTRMTTVRKGNVFRMSMSYGGWIYISCIVPAAWMFTNKL